MEVCVEYFESAVNAERGGAVRLELCSALSEGGLTPSVGLLKKIKSVLKIPVCIMIRPRTGNDFIHSSDEIDIMVEDIKVMKENGADGLVFGALTSEQTVDREAMGRLMKASGNTPVTFHRAFDMTIDPFSTLSELSELGVARILTSGQAGTAFDGRELIGKLIRKAQGMPITVIPGCGVNSSNLEALIQSTGASEFHATARIKKKLPLPKSNVNLGHVEDESVIYITDHNKVREMVKIFNGIKLS